MLITRPDLRLALTAGLAAGFGAITALPFNYYLGITVLAVSTGSYGGALGLGRQRLLGSLLGSVVLTVSLRSLQNLPMPLGLAIAMASLRLLGGLLNLKVGYKVGGLILVMGWLVHGDQLDEWLHLRLFWTALGILVSLMSLRLLWPSSAVITSWRQLGDLLEQLAVSLQTQAEDLQTASAGPSHDRLQHRRMVVDLRTRLTSLRALRPQVREELGSLPQDHPIDRLLDRFDATCSQLIGVVQGFASSDRKGRTMAVLPAEQAGMPAAEAALLAAVATRLRLWRNQLQQTPQGSALPPQAPSDGLPWPDRWLALEPWLQSSAVEALPLEPIQHMASRLVLCRQAQLAIEHTEDHWRERHHG
jgi:uncharacterized membrane protein YccC